MRRPSIAAVLLTLCALSARAGDWTGATGDRSRIAEPRAVVVRDAKTWESLWAEHAGGEAPAVAFPQEAVVAVFLGRRPTSGYAVALKTFVTVAGDRSVLYREEFRAEKGRALRGESFPYALKVVPDAPGTRIELVPETAPAADAAETTRGVKTLALKAPRLEDFAAELRDGLNAGPAGARTTVFDSASGQKASLVAAAFTAAPAAVKTLPAVRCTPGVDCPSEPKKSPRCTPGVDCPPSRKQPRCTPGVDCPGSGNPGGGATPLPPNYRRRPDGRPRRLPPADVPYDQDRVDVASHWHLYRDDFGRSRSDTGSWRRDSGQGVLTRGGTETGKGQGTNYSVTLKSLSYRNTYALYYRYVGENCDPNDNSRCLDWYVQYRWFYDGREQGTTRSIDITVDFSKDKDLLPWETERFEIGYDGSRVTLSQSDTAFRYDVQGPLIDQQRGTATFEVEPVERRLRAPERAKVGVSLEKRAGGLKLVIDDARADFYDGETLEVFVTVKYYKSFFSRPIVYQKTSRSPLRVPTAKGQGQVVLDLPAGRSGEYYITSWGFRRAGSRISSDAWIDRGSGNTVKH